MEWTLLLIGGALAAALVVLHAAGSSAEATEQALRHYRELLAQAREPARSEDRTEADRPNGQGSSPPAHHPNGTQA